MNLPEAKSALFALLSDDPETGIPVPALTGLVERIYKGEPRPGDTAMPISITILTSGKHPLDQTFELNIYASTAIDAVHIQDTLDELIEAVEGLLDADNHFERGEWRIGYFSNLDVFVANCTMISYREDF